MDYKKTPILSVITVVLNDPNGLERTIKSINLPSQTAEYIVIDGKSNQETLTVIEKYRNSSQGVNLR